MDLLSRVKEMEPHFADNELKMLDDWLLMRAQQFSKIEDRYSCASINIHEVTGTAYPDYAADDTWLNRLLLGRRMPEHLKRLQEDPSYYYSTVAKPDMKFIKIGSEIYMGDEGFHRACIARFLFFYEGLTTFHGVSLQEYVIDEAFENAFNRLEALVVKDNLPIQMEIRRDTTRTVDFAGWKRDCTKLSVYVKNIKTGFEAVLSLDDIMDIIATSQNPFRKIKGKYKHLFKRS